LVRYEGEFAAVIIARCDRSCPVKLIEVPVSGRDPIMI
jgi:hypothetical protein